MVEVQIYMKKPVIHILLSFHLLLFRKLVENKHALNSVLPGYSLTLPEHRVRVHISLLTGSHFHEVFKHWIWPLRLPSLLVAAA